MDIQEILNYISSNGVAIVLLVYFIFNNNKSLLSLKDAITELTHANTELKDLIKTFIDMNTQTSTINLNKK
jgi:hypothetical protein